MRRSLRQSVLVLALALFGLAHADEAPTTRTQQTLTELFGRLIDGGEWRTPNPNHDGTASSPSAFVLRYRWGPHRQHMIGELLGAFEDANGERETLYWSLYAIHNPVTDDVLVSQIGANGALASGRIVEAADGKHVIEQILFGPDGSMRAVRHEETFAADGKSYTSDVFERDENGAWEEVRNWVWTRSLAP